MGQQAEEYTLQHAEAGAVISGRSTVIANLQAEVDAGRSTSFNRTFLQHLYDNPTLSVADAWDNTEGHFSKQAGVNPRRNPYR